MTLELPTSTPHGFHENPEILGPCARALREAGFKVWLLWTGDPKVATFEGLNVELGGGRERRLWLGSPPDYAVGEADAPGMNHSLLGERDVPGWERTEAVKAQEQVAAKVESSRELACEIMAIGGELADVRRARLDLDKKIMDLTARAERLVSLLEERNAVGSEWIAKVYKPAELEFLRDKNRAVRERVQVALALNGMGGYLERGDVEEVVGEPGVRAALYKLIEEKLAEREDNGYTITKRGLDMAAWLAPESFGLERKSVNLK